MWRSLDILGKRREKTDEELLMFYIIHAHTSLSIYEVPLQKEAMGHHLFAQNVKVRPNELVLDIF